MSDFVPIVVTPANTAYAIACAPIAPPPRCARLGCAFRGCIRPGWLYWTSIALDQRTGADKDRFTYHLACVSQVQAHNLCAAYGAVGGEDVGDEEAMRCARLMRGYASLPLLQRQPFQRYIAALVRGDAEQIAKDLEWVAPLKDINAGEAKKPTTVLPKPVRLVSATISKNKKKHALKMSQEEQLKRQKKLEKRRRQRREKRKRKRERLRHPTYEPGGAVASSSKKLRTALPETTKTEVKNSASARTRILDTRTADGAQTTRPKSAEVRRVSVPHDASATRVEPPRAVDVPVKVKIHPDEEDALQKMRTHGKQVVGEVVGKVKSFVKSFVKSLVK